MEFTSSLKTYFRINSFAFNDGRQDYICRMTHWENDTLFFIVDTLSNLDSNGVLQITFSSGLVIRLCGYAISVFPKKIMFKIRESLIDGAAKYFMDTLKKLEGQKIDLKRRSEPRQKIISNEEIKLFGLKDKKQTVLFLPCRIKLDCYFVDVSMHGFKIVTENFGNFTRNSETVQLLLKFQNTPKNIIINADKKNLNIIKDKYITVSARIKEPVPYIWQENFLHLIENN